jgi:hypothetical protein
MKARQERDAPASRRLQAKVDALWQPVNAARAAHTATEEAAMRRPTLDLGGPSRISPVDRI